MQPFALKGEEEEEQLAAEVYELLVQHWSSLERKLEGKRNADDGSTVDYSTFKAALQELGFRS